MIIAMRTPVKSLPAVTCVLILGTTLAFAQNRSTTAGVLEVEKNRTEALVHSDLPALDKLLADDLTYVHATGKVDTKTTLLDAIRSGDLRYLSWDPKELHVRTMGDTAVLTGAYHVRAVDQRVQGEPVDVNVIILSVYAKRGGHWQQIAWQSTREQSPHNH